MKASAPASIPPPLRSTGEDFGLFGRLLLKQFTKIKRGRLILKFSGREHVFGDSQASSPINITVLNPVFFRKACLGGSLGVADSYSAGDWETNDLVGLFRLFLQNFEVMDDLEGGWASLLNKLARWGYMIGQKNTVKGSRRNIALHYDLGNNFYELMLDPTMTYSCGIFADKETTLKQASIAKYDRIIEQLDIKHGQTVLEIGCGWGGFAQRLLETTGAKWTGTTISKEQHSYTLRQIEKGGFKERATLLQEDYRTLQGSYDRVVSIEMIEAVGHEYLPTYFSKISDLLAADGASLVQAITMPDHRYDQYLTEVDYIRTRVFPGSCVPSVSAMISAVAKKSDLRPTGVQDIGYHYARTLREWRLRFLKNEEAIKSLGYDDSFRRAWIYYLCYCEAGFEEGYTGDIHLLLTKPNCKVGKGFTQ
ncbi:cyclopropane-fatty-acyl-phospholipid synthase family protein [Opitutales bacterium]|nr:cyclopropane-fatty-acyl-phospholipid synthase family protein [Opitutales bacterium]